MKTIDSSTAKGVVETEEETGQDKAECYGEAPDFRICFKLPRIIFKSIITEPKAGLLRQLAIATVRRYFYLTEDWKLMLSSTRYSEFEGEVVIPRKVNGQLFEFDGASIPFPWLVSFLTIGIIRPLGVLLIASIVHDFAFRHGYLRVKKQGGEVENIPIARHVADRLFKEMITVVNGNSIVGFLGWYFVRLGFWFVPYNGKYREGEKPIAISISFFVILTLFCYGWSVYSFVEMVFSFLALYLSFYVLTLNRLGVLTAKTLLIITSGILIVIAYVTVKESIA